MLKRSSLAATVLAAASLVLAIPASGAPRNVPAPYAATANAMVGVSQPLNVFVPKAGSTSVTFTASSSSASL